MPQYLYPGVYVEERETHYGGFNFLVTINGISDDRLPVSGAFAEVSGLEVEVPAIENGNENRDVKVTKISSYKKSANITCKRGISTDSEFINWILNAMKGEIVHSSGSVILLDEKGQEAMRWNFTQGWPSEFTGPGLDAGENEIAIETLVICHEGLEIEG